MQALWIKIPFVFLVLLSGPKAWGCAECTANFRKLTLLFKDRAALRPATSPPEFTPASAAPKVPFSLAYLRSLNRLDGIEKEFTRFSPMYRRLAYNVLHETVKD